MGKGGRRGKGGSEEGRKENRRLVLLCQSANLNISIYHALCDMFT